MKSKTSLVKQLQVWGCIFLLAIFVGLLLVEVFGSRRAFSNRAAQMRGKYIARQKEIIRQEVMRTVSLIRYERAQSEEVTREILRSRVLEAESIARHLFEKYRETKSHEEIQQLIIEALRPIRFAGGNGYYFATSLDGVELLFADRPEMEGRNLLALRDTQGQYVIKDMIEIAISSGEGFYEYHWTKPQAEGRDFKKISFIKRFEPLAGFIGTGLYVEDVEHEIKKKVLSAISRIRFGKEGYLFVNRLNGMLWFPTVNCLPATRSSGRNSRLLPRKSKKYLRRNMKRP